MLISPSALSSIMPRCPESQLQTYALALSSAMEEHQINTVTRAAAFLGQLALESGELKHWVELADGSAYEGRASLGNTQPGDGPLYRGRGPIQLTGRANYLAAGEALGVDLVANPELVAQPEHGFRVAAWFWRKGAGMRLSAAARKRLGPGVDLNDVADRGDFLGCTMAINGGETHHDRRLAYTHRALEVLGTEALLQA